MLKFLGKYIAKRMPNLDHQDSGQRNSWGITRQENQYQQEVGAAQKGNPPQCLSYMQPWAQQTETSFIARSGSPRICVWTRDL